MYIANDNRHILCKSQANSSEESFLLRVPCMSLRQIHVLDTSSACPVDRRCRSEIATFYFVTVNYRTRNESVRVRSTLDDLKSFYYFRLFSARGS